MIAIVCTYFQRQMQLEKTLASLCQYKCDDFVFIVVDDGSPDEIRLPEVPFDVEIVRVKNKTWRNTTIPVLKKPCAESIAGMPKSGLHFA